MSEFKIAGPPMVPHNREHEEAVLGGIFINPGAYDEVEFLQPDMFYIHRNGMVFDAMRRVAERNEPIDTLTVATELNHMGLLAEIGGDAYITKLINNVPSSLYVSEYAKDIKATYTRRMALAELQKGTQLVYDESQNMDLSPVLDRLHSLTTRPDGTFHMSHALDRTMELIEYRSQNDVPIGMPFDIPSMDKTSKGARHSTLIFVAGPPGVGKTVFTTQVAMLWSTMSPGAIISPEMEEESMMMRIISAGSGIPEDRLEEGNLWDTELPRLTKTVELLKKAPIWFSDDTSWTTHELRAELTKLKYNHGIKWFLFDYLQLAEDKVTGEEYQQIGLVAKRLRKMCKSLGITGLVVSSVTKTGFNVKKPSLADLRGSGQALHEGDMVYWIHPWELNEENEDELTIAKADYPYLRRMYELKKRRGSKHMSPITLRFAPEIPRLREVTYE